MQRIRPLARTLGATPAYADELARIFWEGIYPYVPARYRSERCRAGGPLDLRPQARPRRERAPGTGVQSRDT